MAEKKIIDCYDVKKQTEAVKQLRKEFDKFLNQKVVEITLENKAFAKNIEQSERRLQGLTSMSHMALLCVNDQATANIEKAITKANQFGDSVYTAKLAVDTEAAYDSISKIESKLENLQGNIKIDVTIGGIDKENGLKQSFQDNPWGTIYGGIEKAENILSLLQGINWIRTRATESNGGTMKSFKLPKALTNTFGKTKDIRQNLFNYAKGFPSAVKEKTGTLFKNLNPKLGDGGTMKNFRLPKALTNTLGKAKAIPKGLSTFARGVPSAVKGAASTAAKVLPRAVSWTPVAAGMIDGGYSIIKGLTSKNKYDKVHDVTEGISTSGLTAAGAAIGTFIAPGIGTAIGGSLGYIGGKLFGGFLNDKVADKLAWEDKATSKYADDGRAVLSADSITSGLAKAREIAALGTSADNLKGASQALLSASQQNAAEQTSPWKSFNTGADGKATSSLAALLLPEQLQETVKMSLTGETEIMNQPQVTAADFGIPSSISTTVGVRIAPVITTGLAAVQQIGLNVGSLINGKGSKPSHNYRGGIVRGFAEGGYVAGGAQLITVAEEGTPEAIIPLGKHRRKRALELFQQVGGYLEAPGFSPKGFAAGGIAGGAASGAGFSGKAGAVIENCSVSINVSAGDGQSLVESIRAHRQEISEEIAGVFNSAFKGQFANTPA